MSDFKKVTVSLEVELLEAARFRALETDQTLSEYCREAILVQLAADFADLKSVRARTKQSRQSLSAVLKSFKKRKG